MRRLSSARAQTRYYDGFRGVDFSAEYNTVDRRRFPQAVNVYKDYMGTGGGGVTTIPGFRERFDFREIVTDVAPNSDFCVHGIYRIPYSAGDVEMPRAVVCHVGTCLFLVPDYMESMTADIITLSTLLQSAPSCATVIDGKLYMLDGASFRVVDGTTYGDVTGYVPTTYISRVPDGEHASNGVRYEQRNLLSHRFRNTFVPTATATVYTLSEQNLQDVFSVQLYGVTLTDGYTVDLVAGTVTFDTPLATPDTHGYDAQYAGLVITATHVIAGDRSLITHCTIMREYDGCLFFAGNPAHQAHIYHTAVGNPTYVGEYNYIADGSDDVAVTGMLRVANELLVLKEDSVGEPTMYYHTPKATGEQLIPRIYPASHGLSGVGMMGDCALFLDEPVFLSRRGLLAVTSKNLLAERSVEMRSTNINGKLLTRDISTYRMTVWNGYLLIYGGGEAYLADSRQRFRNDIGEYEYEWFYLDGIGSYEGQYTAYLYAESITEALSGCGMCVAPTSYVGSVANADSDNVTTCSVTEDGEPLQYAYVTTTVTDIDGSDVARNYYVEPAGYMTGGTFCPSTYMTSIDGNAVFGTTNGRLCMFNHDMAEEGSLPPEAYSFDNRPIYCAVLTAFDNAGYPNYLKNTVKNSLVIKLRSMTGSGLSVYVRTNKEGWRSLGDYNSGRFNFLDLDFSRLTFCTDDQQHLVVAEKQKGWLEKQLLLLSNAVGRPFGLTYICYDFIVTHRP